MKTVLSSLIFPLTVHAAGLQCNADLSTPETPFLSTKLNETVTDFSSPQLWTSDINGTDFVFTVQTGLTSDIIDESEDEPVHVGKPGLRSLVIFKRDRSQIARIDVPDLVVQNAINLTIGSQVKGQEFRIHVFCQLFERP